MAKVSIVIPSRNEFLLAQTVENLFAKAIGEIEIIVVLDGPTSYSLPEGRPELKFIRNVVAKGLRSAINDGAEVATGQYLLKTDAHCIYEEGYDEVLQNDCDDNWVVIARRFTLTPPSWVSSSHMPVDYYYFSCPWTDPEHFMVKHCHWRGRTKRRSHILIDDQMTFQGSMWFTDLDHFRNRIGGVDEKIFGPWAGEPLEIGLKTWLGGGRVIINKNTRYAHLDPRPRGRKKGYRLSTKEAVKGYVHAAHYWTRNKWEDRIHDFDWLIERFWPLPLKEGRHHGEVHYWPENWKEYYDAAL